MQRTIFLPSAASLRRQTLVVVNSTGLYLLPTVAGIFDLGTVNVVLIVRGEF
jgi:hypothetical protein